MHSSDGFLCFSAKRVGKKCSDRDLVLAIDLRSSAFTAMSQQRATRVPIPLRQERNTLSSGLRPDAYRVRSDTWCRSVLPCIAEMRLLPVATVTTLDVVAGSFRPNSFDNNTQLSCTAVLTSLTSSLHHNTYCYCRSTASYIPSNAFKYL